jgi:hypothetical protein
MWCLAILGLKHLLPFPGCFWLLLQVQRQLQEELLALLQ